jgi:hypothetical protein
MKKLSWLIIFLFCFGCITFPKAKQEEPPSESETYVEDYMERASETGAVWSSYTDQSTLASGDTFLFRDIDDATAAKINEITATQLASALAPFIGAGELADNSVLSADINTIVDTIYWPSAAMSADGTECSDASEVTINSGPKVYTIACPMTTSETDGYIYGQPVVLPDSFDQTADVIFKLTAYLTTDGGAGTWHGVIAIQCQTPGDGIDSTWGTGIGLDLTPVDGDVVNDVIQDVSTAVDTDTTGEDCDPGDILFWRWKSCDTDATPSTGCTSSAGFENDMSILGVSMEYTSNVGD